jgi:hypothetical protein
MSHFTADSDSGEELNKTFLLWVIHTCRRNLYANSEEHVNSEIIRRATFSDAFSECAHTRRSRQSGSQSLRLVRLSLATSPAILRFHYVRIVVRHPKMPAAAVPEATVNEDSDALRPENEVGVTGEWLVSPPASNAGSTQNGRQFQFRVFVATGADGGHDLRAFML